MLETAVKRMDDAQLSSKIESIVGFRPRAGQVQAIRRLVIEEDDLILIAPTGWGKSVVFQAVPALAGGICIMIMPLMLLQEDQAAAISRIPGCKPCILNAGTNSKALLDDIKRGAYTHVLVGPEIVLSARFKAVLNDPTFRSKLVLVAIDEAHVVWEWGESFRKHYSQLVVLRSLISSTVPWLACSATLDPQTLAKVRDLCGFEASVHIQRSSVDRPDIFISLKQIEHPPATFKDLEFLIKPVEQAVKDAVVEYSSNLARTALGLGDLQGAARLISLGIREPSNSQLSHRFNSRQCCMKICKTVVYFDSIAELEAAEALLTAALMRTGCSKTAAQNALQAYHSELADFDKTSISQEFVKPDCQRAQDSSRHRIILATDAMGMGINNPDIRLVVQWKQPATLCSLWQRAGRAARGDEIRGEFIWFVEPRCIAASMPRNEFQGALRSGTSQSRLSQELLGVINSQTCIRKSILSFFGQDATSYLHPAGASSCCSLCRGDKTVFQSTVVFKQPKILASQKHIVEAVKAALLKWRKETARTLFSSVDSREKEDWIMPMPAVRYLSQTASSVDSVDTLGLLLSSRWSEWDLYAASVVDLMKKTCSEAAAAKNARYPPRRRPLGEIGGNNQEWMNSQQKRMKVFRL
ncbi:DNA helicase, ATP-dependent, RecQ type [Ilyonectria robusta]